MNLLIVPRQEKCKRNTFSQLMKNIGTSNVYIFVNYKENGHRLCPNQPSRGDYDVSGKTKGHP